jgi:hypothetical protein
MWWWVGWEIRFGKRLPLTSVDPKNQQIKTEFCMSGPVCPAPILDWTAEAILDICITNY